MKPRPRRVPWTVGDVVMLGMVVLFGVAGACVLVTMVIVLLQWAGHLWPLW